jgi:TPP-dependent pyruvate/acetoin dehydrogenase alpha subunit
MRINIDLKPMLPKLFGRKDEVNKDNNVDVDTSEKDKNVLGTIQLIGVVTLVSFTIGYIMGFNKGVSKNANVYVVK